MKRFVLLVIFGVVLTGCARLLETPPAAAHIPTCADRVAAALVDPFHVHVGVARCMAIPGTAMSDQDLMILAGYYPPIFTQVVASCGERGGSYTYIVRNTADGAEGYITLPVNQQGQVDGGFKIETHRPGSHDPAASCP